MPFDPKPCEGCGVVMSFRRSDCLTCSPKCRQRYCRKLKEITRQAQAEEEAKKAKAAKAKKKKTKPKAKAK